MSTSGLATPLRAARPRASQPEPRRHSPLRFQARDQPSFFEVYGRALGVSIAAHLLFLLLSPLFVRLELPSGDPVGARPGPPGTYVEIDLPPPVEGAPLAILSPPAGVSVAPGTAFPAFGGQPQFGAQPELGAIANTGTGVTVPGTAGSGSPSGTAAGPSAAPGAGGSAGALRPGYRDPRLIVTPPVLPRITQTDQERYAEHLSSRFAAVNDSMAAEAARNSRTSSWTRTDANGNRWGLSPEGLHLGGITVPRQLLPLPAATGDNQRLGADRERQRQRDEIQRQEDDRVRRAAQEERTRQMRAAEDARRGSDGN